MISAKNKTYEVDIWMGLNPGYDKPDGFIEGHNELVKVRDICQKYVEGGLCVTLTKTTFVYTGGNEPGVRIGLINYPRFPVENRVVLNHAMKLAEILMDELKQFRCTVMDSEMTYVCKNEFMPSMYEDR